ncbi:MAG: ABC transporter ATP-binding protein [Lachnospiraceae bacterium]|nr:ABC transporter ATP-binding protein [Lachnospiraceae bacterium]
MELQVKGIQKTYGKFGLDVSIEVLPGQITGLVGKNGAGKSTTFKSILGLVKTEGGEILLDGKPVETMTNKEREKLGVVLSNASFSGWLTISDIIPVLRSMYEEFEEDYFKEQCEKMELPMKKPIKEFSTGMAAKLKVLVAISHKAELLIMDEPTSGLDVMARNEILDLLRDYMLEENRSILISSHISSDLETLCDDLYMIDGGKILMHEETDVLLADYGVLKLTDEQYKKIEKEYVLKIKKDSNSYTCLTKEKAFFAENYPDVVIEKATIDDVFTLMIQGE